MKKYKAILISVVALLIIAGIGVYFVIGNDKEEKSGSKDVFECLASDVVEYSVSDGKSSFVLVKTEDGWIVQENDKAVLEQEKVQALVGNVALVSVHDVDSGINFHEFDKLTKKEVNIGLTDGAKHKFEFAELNKETCALRISGHDEIYLAYSSLMNILAVKLEDIRVPLVFDNMGGFDKELDYYSFVDFDKTKTVIRAKTASEISADDSSSYTMEEPYRRNVDNELFEQQIVVKLPNISAKSYIDDPVENLEEYGLNEESRAELRFTFDGIENILYLGKTDGGQIYATKKGTDDIYAMSLASVEFLHTEPFYVLQKGILKESLEDVERIIVPDGEIEYDVKRSQGANGSAEFFVNGKAASEYAYKQILNELDKIEISSEILKAPEISDEITVKINYSSGKGSQTFLFVHLNEKEYAMFVNNTAEFAVNKEVVDNFMETLKTISKNPLKTEEKG